MQINTALAFKGEGNRIRPFQPITAVLEVPRGIDPVVALEGYIEEKQYQTSREFYFASSTDPMESLLERFHKSYIRQELRRCWDLQSRSSNLRRIL